MYNQLSKPRTFIILLVASFGLITSPVLGELAAASKLSSEFDSAMLDAQFEEEATNMIEADAAYVRAIRERFN
ncbi:hypothetical protein C7Y66_04190 [Chroococcidiopsis sp. CCALA 051]|jgi:hypothetical protein|uniref:hypothetical protein n=1 Tax=Chroococcidiopsis sp. CCALA 051 TaxID=869949 RepID=UPI000D0DCC5A|nr:hypothetical protein [Chroococcidiopsis sp. CCALA 051]PSM50357.1 hypothetical protein C7Y66_04190 [Chroococcidiopsis sp. CCALA 051]